MSNKPPSSDACHKQAIPSTIVGCVTLHSIATEKAPLPLFCDASSPTTVTHAAAPSLWCSTQPITATGPKGAPEKVEAV